MCTQNIVSLGRYTAAELTDSFVGFSSILDGVLEQSCRNVSNADENPVFRLLTDPD